MKACTQLEDGGNAAFAPEPARGGLKGAGEQLQQGTLASTVVANDAHTFTRHQLEANILQSPVGVRSVRQTHECRQAVQGRGEESVTFAQALYVEYTRLTASQLFPPGCV